MESKYKFLQDLDLSRNTILNVKKILGSNNSELDKTLEITTPTEFGKVGDIRITAGIINNTSGAIDVSNSGRTFLGFVNNEIIISPDKIDVNTQKPFNINANSVNIDTGDLSLKTTGTTSLAFNNLTLRGDKINLYNKNINIGDPETFSNIIGIGDHDFKVLANSDESRIQAEHINATKTISIREVTIRWDENKNSIVFAKV